MKQILTLILSLTLSLVMAQEAPLTLPDAEIATSRQQVRNRWKNHSINCPSGDL